MGPDRMMWFNNNNVNNIYSLLAEYLSNKLSSNYKIIKIQEKMVGVLNSEIIEVFKCFALPSHKTRALNFSRRLEPSLQQIKYGVQSR